MSILIKNGKVFDGSGQPAFEKDILIRGEKISKIGDIKEKNVDKVIDAKGSYVFPGFIDINSDSDHHLYLLSNPDQSKFIEQGITTIIGGNEGISLAPLYNEEPLNFIQDRAAKNFESVNINWESFDHFLNTIESRGVGVNFGSLVGYSTVRKIIAQTKDKLSEIDLRSIAKLIKDSIKQGALGISTGFEEVYSNTIEKEEVIDILKQVKDFKPIFVSELRDPQNNPLDSLKELIDITKETSINTQISNIQPIKAQKENYQEIFTTINEKSNDFHINFDCHPYTLRKIPAYKLLPAEFVEKSDIEKTLELLHKKENKEKIIEHLKTKTRKRIKIIHMPPEFSFMESEFIKDIAQNRGETQAETLFNLMKMTSLKMVVLLEDVNEKVLDELIKSERSIITSDGLHLEDSELNPFQKFINNVIDDDFPLEKAIAKITSIPANKYGIENRGEVKAGNFADIVIFKDGQVKDVLVNGKVAMENQETTNQLNGKVIKS